MTTAAWPINSLTGEPEPPAKDFLINCLKTFGGDGADHQAVISLAVRFVFTIMLIRARLDKTAVSPKNELKNLYAAARKSIKARRHRHWLDALAAVKEETRQRIGWKPKLVSARRPPKKPYSVPGKVISPRTKVLVGPVLAPHPRDALPLIRAAMLQLKTQPAARRSADPLFDELDNLLREAWTVLRGSPVPKAVSAERAGGGHLRSPLIDLARDIDRHFKLGVYVAKDSRRLRGLSRPA